MRVALISPYPDITNYGLRLLSAVLRAHGHSTRLICMPDFAGDGEAVHSALSNERYPPQVLAQLVAQLGDCDLVGISLMTHYFATARQLTEAIKAAHDLPVIWGGFHPSVRPFECAAHADFVATGDAEDLMLQLVAALEAGTDDLSHIPSLLWRRGDEVVRNHTGSLKQDLDSYPPPDWSGDDHWLLFEDALHPVNQDLLHRFLRNGTISRMFGRVGYQTMTGRGCPHACTYCGNSFYRDLYARQVYVRYRSVEHVLAELEAVVQAQPFIDLIWFSDDSFFGRSLPDLRDFCRAYKQRVGLPFYLLGSPGTITEDKYAALVDAGLLCIQVGIEHGSPRIQRLFKRSTMGNEAVLQTAAILAKYAHKTAPPQYDLVYDLAYETLEDKLDTLRLVSQLPKPYRLQVFSIIYYPGTALHTLAVADGLVSDEQSEIYDRMFSERHDSYAATLLFLARTGRLPHSLLRVLIDPRWVRLATSDFATPAGATVKLALRVFRRIVRNPTVARARALRSVRAFEARLG